MFLYGSAAWTLTETLAKRIDCCFIRLLRSALEFIWKDHVSKKRIYAEVPKATDTAKQKDSSWVDPNGKRVMIHNCPNTKYMKTSDGPHSKKKVISPILDHV